MITHDEAKSKFKKCRNKERGYKLANNTKIQERGHAFAVRLHKTDVVMIRPDGTYRLNTGGWRTVTTKNRMNMTLPGSCCVSQVNGLWFVGPENTPYSERMLIGSDGKAIGAKHLGDLPKIKRIVDRRISQFIKLLTKFCQGRDMGTWDSYGKRTVPHNSNKTHLRKLWITARQTVSIDIDDGFRLVHLATLARGHGDPKFVWDNIIRDDCLKGNESHFIADNLRSFMRTRKPLIAEMIAEKELELC